MTKSTRHTFQISFFHILLISVVLLNLIILDIFILWKFFSTTSVLGVTSSTTCPQACVNLINKSKTTSTSSVKEYFVPLGSGSNATSDWTDVAGASTTVDGNNYGKIKKVVFEATIYVPAGSQRLWVRLLNATDGTYVAGSEVTTESNGPILLVSDAISLHSGTKTYQVQMKSQLKATTNLTQSRIRITTY